MRELVYSSSHSSDRNNLKDVQRVKIGVLYILEDIDMKTDAMSGLKMLVLLTTNKQLMIITCVVLDFLEMV